MKPKRPCAACGEQHRLVLDLHQKLAARDEMVKRLEGELAMAREPKVCERTHLERKRLPDERWSSTKVFRINGKADGVSAHLHAGEHEDGSFGEVFVRLGSCVPKDREDVDWQALAVRLSYLARVFVDAWAVAVSLGVQHGMPLDVYLDKHQHNTDVPGYTGDPVFPRVNGLLDFISKWLRAKYCPPAQP